MGSTLNSYLEKNIPFALFRAPEKSIRFVAQLSPINLDSNFEQTGFHFAPFSEREKMPYVIIKNDIDVSLEKNGFRFSFPNIENYNFEEPDFGKTKGGKSQLKEIAISFDKYEKDIQAYLDFFETNETQKAIYSRLKNIPLPENFDLFSFFGKIENSYPKALVYLVHLPGIGFWAGASPETLLKYENGIAETVALAGTQKINDEEDIGKMTWGEKEIEEHQMVADYIFEKIKNDDLEIIQQSETYTSKAGAMAHLKQRFQFKISKNQLSSFIKKLQPTPAVCGLPKSKAMDLIYQTEPYDRQYYAGYLGMFEKNNTVDFYVNLRCMKIYDNKATLFVGGGITANSDSKKEWEETELKAKTLLTVLESSIAVDFSRP